jgi:hypothetical protein
MAVGLTSAGVAGCGTGLAVASRSGSGYAAGASGRLAGSAAASPAVIVTVPAVPGDASAGSATPTGAIVSNRRTLTVADDGATVRLRVGQVVAVALVPDGGTWDAPRASGDAVRRASSSGGYPSLRPARAIFRALRTGQSVITSLTDAQCLHSQPSCEIPQRLWQVLVIVVRSR